MAMARRTPTTAPPSKRKTPSNCAFATANARCCRGAINLKDPSLIEAWENGRIAVPFEIILRLAAVRGRNDPVGFVMKFTRSSTPDLWRRLENPDVGKLNMYRD